MKKTTTNQATNNATITNLVDVSRVDEYLPKSFVDFKALALNDVVKNPIEFKNAVMIDCIKDLYEKSSDELNAHIVNMNKATATIKQAELDKKLGIYSSYDEKQVKTYTIAQKFMLDADMKRVDLQNKLDAYEDTFNEICNDAYKNMLSLVYENPTRLQNWILLKSICSGDFSKIANIFKPMLASAEKYRACKSKQIDEKSADFEKWNKNCCNLYSNFKKECESLFSLYNVKEDDEVLSMRSIRMNNGEYNNLSIMVSGLDIEMDANGKMKMTVKGAKSFNKMLAKVLVLKKQNVRLVIE